MHDFVKYFDWEAPILLKKVRGHPPLLRKLDGWKLLGQVLDCSSSDSLRLVKPWEMQLLRFVCIAAWQAL